MNDKLEKKIVGAVIIGMSILLLGLCTVLVTGVRRVGRENPSSSLIDFLSARRIRGPLPIAEAPLIRSWMTFDYVNRLFGLPADYLKTNLHVTDSRYPNLSLSEYYSDSLGATTSASFLDAVRMAILDSTTTPR